MDLFFVRMILAILRMPSEKKDSYFVRTITCWG